MVLLKKKKKKKDRHRAWKQYSYCALCSKAAQGIPCPVLGAVFQESWGSYSSRAWGCCLIRFDLVSSPLSGSASCFSWKRRPWPTTSLWGSAGTLRAAPAPLTPEENGGTVAGCWAHPQLHSKSCVFCFQKAETNRYGLWEDWTSGACLNRSVNGFYNHVFGYILSMYKIPQQFSTSRDEREKYELHMWQLRVWLNIGRKVIVGLMFLSLDLGYNSSVTVGI